LHIIGALHEVNMEDRLAALNLSPIELRNMLKTVVIIVDDNFDILYVNDAALALLETGLKQIHDRKFYEFFLEDGLDRDTFEEAFKNREDFSETEVQLCFKDGRCVLTDITATCFDLDGQRLMLLEIRQIDKQKKITQETQQHAQQRAARELVRGLAHEIKNPLGGIRGAAQLLEKELENPEHKEFTQMIVDQSDRLRNLVDRLLGPNSLPQFAWTNMHAVIEKARSVIELDVSNDIAFQRDYDVSIPDLYVDPDMLQQALLNIARNSMQAMKAAKTPDPRITLKTRVERQSVIKGKRHGLCALISIIDNGPGIPRELKDTIFYPMVSTKKNGSGLGLSIAQTLTDHHDGKIDVESYPGYTEFTLYLPIKKRTDSYE
jgi:two-component system nitrogen regulation sensor histidine kinase GlnL